MLSELRKTRNQQRTERRRQALLDAAGKVFTRQGFLRTLVSDIVAEAHVGQGTFYRYFPDKRAIFEALLDRFLANVFEAFAGMTANPPQDQDEYREASIVAIRQATEILDRDRDLALLLLREAPTVDSELEDKVSSVYSALVTIARSFLDRAIKEGFARPCNTELVSEAIVGIGAWMANAWWAGRLPDFSKDQVIEQLVDFAFFGIGSANNS